MLRQKTIDAIASHVLSSSTLPLSVNRVEVVDSRDLKSTGAFNASRKHLRFGHRRNTAVFVPLTGLFYNGSNYVVVYFEPLSNLARILIKVRCASRALKTPRMTRKRSSLISYLARKLLIYVCYVFGAADQVATCFRSAETTPSGRLCASTRQPICLQLEQLEVTRQLWLHIHKLRHHSK